MSVAAKKHHASVSKGDWNRMAAIAEGKMKSKGLTLLEIQRMLKEYREKN